MQARRLPALAPALLLLFAVACGDDGGGDGDGNGNGNGGVDADAGADVSTYSISGSVVDFATGEALDSATVSTDGLVPAPTVSVTGSDFDISGVPPHSVFYLLAGSPPDYRNTYSVAVDLREADLTGVEAEVMSEAYLSELADAFGITPTGGTGVLVVQAIDDGGAPLAGVPLEAFDLAAAGLGPYFLDVDRQADAELTATSESGFIVYFDVPPGEVAVVAAEGSDYTMAMSVTPIAATAASVGRVTVSAGGEDPLPMNVSFAGDVRPIFERRGCALCHSGNGPGRDLGNLTLDGSNKLIHRELTEEISPNHGETRVNLESPADSLVLTMPSREEPPDAHPNVTFASPQDPDYRILLAWITEGALDN